MNSEFFEALEMLEKEKGIPADYLLEKIENAIVIAVKRDYPGVNDVVVNIDKEKGRFDVAIRKTVSEEAVDPVNEIVPEEAVKIDKTAQIGDTVDVQLQTKQFGRIAAQTAKHVIRQGIREAERGQMLRDFQNKEHDIVTALVTRIDQVKGTVTLEIDGSETILPRSEQTPDETLREGDRIKVYVVEVAAGDKGPRIMISRTHPGLVKRLFEMEVPEIYDGTVEIKAVSREAGSRTKIAVSSRDENVDAIGSCIGPRGSRVAKVVDELGGEKIDVVKYSETPEEFIAAALSPATVLSVTLAADGSKSCRVTVPDGQLSLAIGNKGQNARLAAKLVGWKIDIRPESGFYGEDPDEV